MYPNIDIEFENGNLAQVVDTPDGVGGLLASAVAVADKFALNTAYMVKSMVDVAALGILPDVNNYRLYKTLKEFYAEAGEGTELWLMGFAKTQKVSDWFTSDPGTGKAPAEKLLDAANGKLNFIMTSFSPTGDYVVTLETGIDSDVFVAANLAQLLAENYTKKYYAPLFAIIEAYAFNGNKVVLSDLLQRDWNRVMIMIGDSEKRTGVPVSNGAAVGIVGGRFAKIQVHQNIGRLLDGPTANLKAYIVDTPAELYDFGALNDKGYVTFRNHVRKSGYYFVDDHLACPIADDYHMAARRRVIDKAYRLGYDALLPFLLDSNNVLPNGTIDPIYASTIENAVETLIFQQMSANDELSYNPKNAKDRGVIFRLDLTHNVTSTSKIKIRQFQVASKGYNKFFQVPLGFVPVTSNTN
ncbi:hypothetical protein FNO01nite_30490 [Flavobacterium noncentrifugens]|uniref:DUF2586 family protein n=1 Tax=Flavobacterium noncentrifugens TaxID=1128970 RepID=A0A1G9BV36_9FLAO|nr:DUF2586 family protein [Flavobacterium noncentrifugens]GEP52377.1 hypothetical protein FNO01nite_30490 [Flavobacterium noncentrifugens]SDK43230.1 hypothetical protein SAMN04487935_3362 [Flavobacterium noncentrifugens]